MQQRWYDHKCLLKNGKHNKHLQKTYNRDGLESFEFIIFENDIPFEDLLSWEQAVIDFFESYLSKNGFNARRFANSNFGLKMSEETKIKIGKANLGRIMTQEQRNRMAKPKNKTYLSHKRNQGEKHPQSKLKEFEVREIKFKYLVEKILTQKEIANIFNVKQSLISDIKRGKKWQHIV